MYVFGTSESDVAGGGVRGVVVAGSDAVSIAVCVMAEITTSSLHPFFSLMREKKK